MALAEHLQVENNLKLVTNRDDVQHKILEHW